MATDPSDVVAHVKRLMRDKSKPWLIVGKGPTAAKFKKEVVKDSYLLTLNHACQLAPPNLAHFVDIEAVQQCRGTLLCYLAMNPETFLVTPAYPHINNVASGYSARCENEAFLTNRDFDAKQRLLLYNATTSRKYMLNGLSLVYLRYFSVVAAFNILLQAGIRRIHTLGIDGGVGYAPMFHTGTHLANGRSSFDIQTGELQRQCRKYRARWIKL